MQKIIFYRRRESEITNRNLQKKLLLRKHSTTAGHNLVFNALNLGQFRASRTEEVQVLPCKITGYLLFPIKINPTFIAPKQLLHVLHMLVKIHQTTSKKKFFVFLRAGGGVEGGGDIQRKPVSQIVLSLMKGTTD